MVTVRGRRQQRPLNWHAASHITVALVVVSIAIPFVPLADAFGFVPIPASLLASVVGITVLYSCRPRSRSDGSPTGSLPRRSLAPGRRKSDGAVTTTPVEGRRNSCISVVP